MAEDEFQSVREYIDAAFRVSTIPCSDKSKDEYRDFSFNILGHFETKANTAGSENDEVEANGISKAELTANSALGSDPRHQFPIWPPDMFGVTASLLERSGAYLHFADSIQTIAPDASGPRQKINPEEALPENDPFGVRGDNRLSLRLVGALWSFGALSISGRYQQDRELTPKQIIKGCAKNAGYALNYLEERFSKEIDPRALAQLVSEIADYIQPKLGFPTAPKTVDAICKEHPKIVATEAARLALKAVIELDAEDRQYSSGKAIADLGDPDSQLRLKMKPYFLILWGTWWLQTSWEELRRQDEGKTKRLISPRFRGEISPADKRWQSAAMRLMIIADEAGKGMGFSQRPLKFENDVDEQKNNHDPKNPPQAGLRCPEIWSNFLKDYDHNEIKLKTGTAAERKFRFPRTLTRSFDDGLGAVLPKARTPGNGCTIRSFSHNLALLPPKGRIRARWARQADPNNRATYNILLVPFPYAIRSVDVEPLEPNPKDDWGFFRVRPGWLGDFKDSSLDQNDKRRLAARESLVEFLKSLLDDQADETINAIVLPEAALDWEAFQIVQAELLKHRPSLELLVCGLNSACLDGVVVPTEGNFVATYMRSVDSVNKSEKPVWQTVDIRAKHHRWRLDKDQLRSYALSHRLSPDKFWWEAINLPPREMLFAEFSSGSILTTLVCEDLARIEPCQVAVRAIGPNLIFVLLMDSAQIVKRWPYQYASVLADDPGSSILTLTSFGLLKRSNLSEDRDSREIAIWREPHGGPPREIKLPKGYHAQLVSLRREFCYERTLDGRGDNHDSALVWKFAGLVPIKSKIAPPGGGPDD